MIKTFRGRLEDGGLETIKLSTKQGLVGYKINKFDIISGDPMGAATESVVKIFTTPVTTAVASVDFTDPTLVGVATYSETDSLNYPLTQSIIFDNKTFNQDIYVTHKSASTTTTTMNYHIELEQVKLDINEATVATVKDMRGRE